MERRPDGMRYRNLWERGTGWCHQLFQYHTGQRQDVKPLLATWKPLYARTKRSSYSYIYIYIEMAHTLTQRVRWKIRNHTWNLDLRMCGIDV